MFSRHVAKSLARYCDGELSAAERRRVDVHLHGCAACRAALEQIQFSAQALQQLTAVSTPPDVWHRIEAAMAAPERRVELAVGRSLQWAAACALFVTLAGSAYWWTRDAATRPWEVAHAADRAPRRMSAGEWVETDGAGTARIIVGRLGTVDVAPDTRVRLGQVNESEYRLSLARGTISAEITAPPRLFIVDTPTSAVVDLGCAYTVTVGDDGGGELRMTTGWAALEWKGRESLVPAGAICRTTPGSGPGTPYFDDASAALKRAVDAFDSGSARAQALDVIIREARVRDTLTLWHLLSRVDTADRVRVYERMAAFAEPPARVSRDQILELNRDALRKWREELAWKW